jgi:hypothetical protein
VPDSNSVLDDTKFMIVTTRSDQFAERKSGRILMGNPIMRSFCVFLSILIFSSIPLVGLAQTPSIDVINFNSELTYFPEGSVSVLFEPKGVFPIDNVFKLELSDASGSFASPTVLATAQEFFTPILNGKIPAGIGLGTGYKLRISYGPNAGPRLSSELPGFLKIGSITTPFLTPYININSNSDGIDFLCLSDPNTNLNPNYYFGSVKQSSSSLLPFLGILHGSYKSFNHGT